MNLQGGYLLKWNTLSVVSFQTTQIATWIKTLQEKKSTLWSKGGKKMLFKIY